MDILESGKFMPSEVGKTVYVWSEGGRKPPADRSRSCVISAHGVESFITSKLGKPKNVKLVYYCPHGCLLDGAQLSDVVAGKLKPKEKMSGKDACQDYGLSKLQGRDKFEDETYAFIQQGMHPDAREKRARERHVVDKQLMQQAKKHGNKVYDERLKALDIVLADIANSAPIYDVVTIRDRRLHNDPTLFEVIGLMENAGFHYNEVHCAFCRGFALSKSPAWNAKKLNTN